MPQERTADQGREPARLVWHVTSSLDGFIAGPGEDAAALLAHTDSSPASQELVQQAGALLIGRRSHFLGMGEEGGAPGPYGSSWSGQRFVVTNDRSHSSEEAGVRFVGGPLEDAVQSARAAAGEAPVAVIGAELARGLIEQGLLDEVLVHVVPLLLGDGVRLFAGADRVALQLTRVTVCGEVTDLRYRVLAEQPGS